jgi:molecular chaperone DnaK
MSRLPLSLGLETLDGVMTTMIDRDTGIPARGGEVFSTAEDDQPAVDIVVLRGERERAGDNQVLGRFRLTGIGPAPRGVPQIDVIFDVDADGVLTVTAAERGGGARDGMTVVAAELAPEEVARAVAEAERNRDRDARLRGIVDIRTGLESAAYLVERRLDELGDDLPVQV